MKTFKIGTILLVLGLLIACKKEEVAPQELVQKHIIGSWPIKYNIRTTFTDKVETKNDTLITYNPIDTLIFTADGQAIKRNKAVISKVGYSISADGETITFASSPASTLRIVFLRQNSIVLGTETFANVAGKEIRTVVADHLIK